MSQKNYRIKTNINGSDQVVCVNLKQGIDTINILSLELNSEDTYYLHTSDYGVIVGRVLGNGAYGVPNVKVSVFVPITNEDSEDYVISTEYPYTGTSSYDTNGKIYNLITKINGSFPEKCSVLDNEGEGNVYKKYWKLTATTNNSGDYMIFGVPVGSANFHYDCDLSDIGLLSQKPYELINKGFNKDEFVSVSEFSDKNVGVASHILSGNSTIEVFPFWGDKDVNKIGITRKDINLDYDFTPTCVFMGSAMTDNGNSYFSTNGQPQNNPGKFSNLVTSSGDIEIIRQTTFGSVESIKENVNGIIDSNGVWCYAIPMNLDRIGMDEEGNIIPMSNPNLGIPTRARVRMRITLTDAQNAGNGVYSCQMLIPNNPPILHDGSHVKCATENLDNYWEFGSNTPDECFKDLYWGKVYSVKQYYPKLQVGPVFPTAVSWDTESEFTVSSFPPNYALPFSGINTIDRGSNTIFPYNTFYSSFESKNQNNKFYNGWKTYLTNISAQNSLEAKGLFFSFENDWINGCLYFPKIKITKTSGGGTNYYGMWTDKKIKKYKNRYITGRHNMVSNSGNYGITNSDFLWAEYMALKNTDSDFSHLTTRFSQIELPIGVVTKRYNSLGQASYYYVGGNVYEGDFFRLYATDIIDLGNIDNKLDNVPMLWQSLPSTTCTFPPLVTPTDFSEASMNAVSHATQTELYKPAKPDGYDIFGNSKNKLSNISKYNDTETGSVFWQSCKNDCGGDEKQAIVSAQERSALFFGIIDTQKNDSMSFFPPTFVNASRICELDVESNAVKTGTVLGEEFIIPINGIISQSDITGHENRSLFATLNSHEVSTFYDTKTHIHKPLYKPLYVNDFDGRLSEFCQIRHFDLVDEHTDSSYLLFRYGDNGSGPATYMAKSITTNDLKANYPNPNAQKANNMNEDLVLTENSFYFYFGLRGGYTAIDKMNELYGYSTFTEYYLSYDYVSSKCDGDVSVTYDFTIHDRVSPYTVSFYQNNILVGSLSDITTNKFTLEDMSCGVYDVEITNGNNEVHNTTINLTNNNIVLSYSQDISNGSLVLYNINGLNITNCSKVTGKSNEFTLTVEKGGKYTIKLTPVNGESDTISFQKKVNKVSVMGNTYNQIFVIFNFDLKNGDAKEYNLEVMLDGNACGSSQLTLEIRKEENEFLMNGIPLNNLYPWGKCIDVTNTRVDRFSRPNTNSINGLFLNGSTTRPKGYIWNSIKTKHFTLDTYNIANSNASQQEKIGWVSKMIGSIYESKPISLSSRFEGLDNKFYHIKSASADSFRTQSSEDIYNAVSGDSCVAIPRYQYFENGYLTNNIAFPHLVGNNYPGKMHASTHLKQHANQLNLNGGNVIVGDKTSLYNNPMIIGKNSTNIFSWTQDGTPTVNADIAYFDTITNHSFLAVEREGCEAIDPPATIKYTNGSYIDGFSINIINGYMDIQTIDSRLDYEFAMKTPLVLPSYSENTPNKVLEEGKATVMLYGGLRMKFDPNTHEQKQYEWIENGMSVKEANAQDMHLYSEVMNEPLAKTNINIGKDEYIDEVKYTGVIKNSEKFTANFVSVNTDFANNKVRAGKSLSIDVSYASPIHFIHDDTSDSYDILYSNKEGNDNLYLASLKNSSLAFYIKNDEAYAGETYTGRCTGANKTFCKWDTFAQAHPWMSGMTQTFNAMSIPTDLCFYVHNAQIDNNETKCAVYPFKQNTSSANNYNGSSGVYTQTVDSSWASGVSSHEELVSDTTLQDCFFYNFETDVLSFLPSTLFMTNETKDVIEKYFNMGYDEQFNEKAYITIPTKTLYHENEVTSCKQGVMLKMGAAFYASKLAIIPVRDENGEKYLSVELYSPLRQNNGVIDWSKNTLSVGNDYHTIGVMESYSANNADVYYDEQNCKFTIKAYNERDAIEFYFKIKNGLKYKVIINAQVLYNSLNGL